MAIDGKHDGEIHATISAEASPISLPQIGKKAADYVASARIALGAEPCDSDEALAHLDKAISSLKRLRACAAGKSARAPRTAEPVRRSA